MPSRARIILTGIAVVATAAAGCGKPPELRDPGSPLPSAAGSGSAEAVPSVGVVPSLPAYSPPTYAPPRSAATTTVPAAPRCGASPSGAQILAAVGRSGAVPSSPPGGGLRVVDGPYCAGGWQYTVVAAAAGAEPLVAVTRGRAGALTVVEIGSDVCSETVDRDAPAGIRVLACG